VAISIPKLWRKLSTGKSLFLIAGPCVIESEALCLKVARSLRDACEKLGITYIFKASYDKANRTSGKSKRGPGLKAGLEILAKVRENVGVPVLTDVHDEVQAVAAADVVDVIQIPAFLCRQTDFIAVAAGTRAIVNLKKGQFLSPQEMGQVVKKAEAAGGERLLVTDRGVTFGYNNLVSDMRAIPIMKEFGYPVVFDATHSVQMPGGRGDKSGGNGEFAPVLANAAVAAGVNGVFIETHPNPDKAWSDGPNMIPLRNMQKVLAQLVKIHNAVR
jgi:2-dehydro-3-deoxyphosphooctonate aldolase (KDO 8-P synthase)